MNIALVGNSKFAHFWCGIIDKVPGAKAYAIYGSSKERNVEAVKEYGLEAQYTDLEELSKDTNIDMVIITSVPSLHAEQSKILLEGGKHVLVEKPPALSYADFKEVADLAKDRKLKYAVDFMMRFDPFYKILQTFIESDILGKILKVDFVNMASDTSLQDGHWFWDKKLSGGIFIEHAVHFFDIYNHLLGNPKLLYSKTYTKPHDSKKEDHVFALVEYPNEVIAGFTHIFNRPSFFEDNGSTIYFENGKVRLDGWYAHTFNGEAVIEKSKLDEFKIALSNADIQVKEISDDTTIQGRMLKFPVHISFKYEADRMQIIELVYSEILKNFIKAIENNLEPETSFDRVKDALIIAEKAKENAS